MCAPEVADVKGIVKFIGKSVFRHQNEGGSTPSPKFCLGWLRRPLLRRLCIFIAETFTDNPQRRFPSKTLPILVKTCHLTNFSVTLKEFNTSLRSLNCPSHRDCSFNVLLLSRSSSGQCYCGCFQVRKPWQLGETLGVNTESIRISILIHISILILAIIMSGKLPFILILLVNT